MQMSIRPIALIILDGWGHSDEVRGNAVAQASTPVFDRLMAEFPSSLLRTSGADVGLPDGQFGNSEVGHLNLGAGFVVDQDLTRIDRAIRDGSLARNEVLLRLVRDVRRRGAALHLIGLVGEGGVHAHARHLDALLALAAAEGPERVFVHALTDGRDAAPDAGLAAIEALEAEFERLGVGRIASVGGRYHAMDRDRRWKRIARAWAAIVTGDAPTAISAGAALRAAYGRGESDEFLAPTIVAPPGADPSAGLVRSGDGIILFNFRADRMRQLLSALTDPDFDGFERERPMDAEVVTLTRYADGQRAAAAFEPIDVDRPIARAFAEAGLRQFHAAETEKYAHVTYFFNGGREAPFEGEERLIVPSPKVATYDLAPEMSARPLTDGVVRRIETVRDAFTVVNFANPDMVGHTGDLSAAIRAVEVVDECLGRLLAAVEAAGGAAVVTADHGNCEMMIDPVTGGPHTAHTTNPVPIALFDPLGARRRPMRAGRLADVAPTLLALANLEPPSSMTGRVLVDVAPSAASAQSDQGSDQGRPFTAAAAVDYNPPPPSPRTSP